MIAVDIFTFDFIESSYEKKEHSTSFIDRIIRVFYSVIIFSNMVCDKLLIHEIRYQVALASIFTIPFLWYVIKYFIPAKFTLYSLSTLKQLDKYEVSLSLLKDKYERLTRNLQKLAFTHTKFDAELEDANEAFVRSE